MAEDAAARYLKWRNPKGLLQCSDTDCAGPDLPTLREAAAIDGATGKSAVIAAHITATSKIGVWLKTPSGDALTVKYSALGTDRVVGASGNGGSFRISALTAAGGGALNAVDASTLDWEVII